MSTIFEKDEEKIEDNETSEKIQRASDVIMDSSQSGFIAIENDNEFKGDTITNNNSWIKFDTVSLDTKSKAQIEGGELLDDKTIEACQTILKSQFPGMNWFQAIFFGQGDIISVPIAKDVLQILLRVIIRVGIS